MKHKLAQIDADQFALVNVTLPLRWIESLIAGSSLESGWPFHYVVPRGFLSASWTGFRDLWRPARSAIETITMIMREVDRLKVIEAVVQTGLTPGLLPTSRSIAT
ncbi:hypothetical protein PQR08_30270, partial [Caballeronia jiangsuensis]